MRPHTLEEFAQNLRITGDYREVEFADEILMLLDIEEEVAEPYSDLCDDVTYHAPKELKKNPAKAAEWLNDRSAELDEITDLFPEAVLDGKDIPDQIKDMIDARDNFETIMRKHGGWTEGDLQDALFALIERAAKPPEYDL